MSRWNWPLGTFWNACINLCDFYRLLCGRPTTLRTINLISLGNWEHVFVLTKGGRGLNSSAFFFSSPDSYSPADCFPLCCCCVAFFGISSKNTSLNMRFRHLRKSALTKKKLWWWVRQLVVYSYFQLVVTVCPGVKMGLLFYSMQDLKL